jgi:hypothetical protein
VILDWWRAREGMLPGGCLDDPLACRGTCEEEVEILDTHQDDAGLTPIVVSLMNLSNGLLYG